MGGMIPIKLKESKEKITPFGGAIVLSELLKSLGIRDYIDKNLPLPKSNAGLLPSSKIIPVLLSMILGGRGYSDVDKLKSDKALCEIFNLKTDLI